MAIPTEKQAIDEIIGREKMYTYEVKIEIGIVSSASENTIKRIVVVDVNHREEALLQAYFDVASSYNLDWIISVKVTGWKEILPDD